MSLNLQFENTILRHLDRKSSEIFIEGTGSYLPLLLCLTNAENSLFSLKKHLLIVESEKEAQEIYNFLSPKLDSVFQLPEFEISPYSSLVPKNDMGSLRLQFLHHISKPKKNGVFIASLNSLSQKTLDKDYLKENTYQFKIGDSLPEPIEEFLQLMGYRSTRLVEDYGQYSFKGGILDLYSPAHKLPLRIELFGDDIQSLRFFDIESQRSNKQEVSEFELLPAKEVFLTLENQSRVLKTLHKMCEERKVPTEDLEQANYAIRNQRDFLGQEFLIDGFWQNTSLPKDFIHPDALMWISNKELQINSWQSHIEDLNADFQNDKELLIRPDISSLMSLSSDDFLPSITQIHLDEVSIKDLEDIQKELGNLETPSQALLQYSTSSLSDFLARTSQLKANFSELQQYLKTQFLNWKKQGIHIVISAPQEFSRQRALQLFKGMEMDLKPIGHFSEIEKEVSPIPGTTEGSFYISSDPLLQTIKLTEEHLIFIKFKDLFGKTVKKKSSQADTNYFKKLDAIRFGELKSGDFVVHIQHGLAKFVGLKTIDVQSIPTEFIELHYKEKDKLFLPIHRINQIKVFSGPVNENMLDKLGSSSFEKAKIKVKNHLRDIANDLLKIYALRETKKRPAYELNQNDLFAFENEFAFDETEDQQKAIEDIQADLQSDKPMDRLICGDVGFGKTEVAMRAAFNILQAGRQVAVLAPTTVLTFQHLRSFKKRLESWGFNIKSLNRFVSAKEIKETIKGLKDGSVDLVVGTHRLLSKDIEFKDLGLMICDEEQKFGVKHKEKIRQLRAEVDTLVLSATPIPRTLNMSLLGLRDLSLITTAPIDRQPIRTFITKFNPEIVKKAIYAEVQRGGQVFYVHNRVQSIYGLHDELKKLFPDLRIAVGHGQMEEKELEKVMLAFMNKEIDVLLATTIIESGVDIPNANTMFIDNAQQFGLSQLYQLRGRVGRSKNKAYCYLVIPKGRQLDKEALERLKILQENSNLGSGIRIAHYDLELRGAGNILGEDQSGHVNVVGYDLYMDLLQQAVQEARGFENKTKIEPDINVPIPALIPSDYIADIRSRLAYYKALSSIEDISDIDDIEDDLKDQFGKPPIEVINLFSMMLVKKLCRDKGIKDVSCGPKNLSLRFDSSTNVSIEKLLKLSQLENKKYKLLPDDRLLIRINEPTWPRIYEEINFL